jgi:glycosyltransferase involved in cell wall biosynthesis
LRVGFLGRIDPKKNLDLLIEAMAALPEEVHLTIAGDGPADLVGSLRLRADRLGVSDRLEWLGFVDSKERTRLLEGLDLLAMPSAFESFGLSAAEAMLHGVPVVVSQRTGIAELIRRHGGGRIVEADVASIAAAIGELEVDRESLRTMGAQGQAAVMEELDYVRVGQALHTAYVDATEVMHQARARRRRGCLFG